MKKLPKIIPCVCTTHTPVSTVSSEYGMPILLSLLPRNGGEKIYWSVLCPMCGRGSRLMDEPSAYYAVVRWNNIMTRCYKLADRDIQYDKDYDVSDPDSSPGRNQWIENLPAGRFILPDSENFSKD